VKTTAISVATTVSYTFAKTTIETKPELALYFNIKRVNTAKWQSRNTTITRGTANKATEQLSVYANYACIFSFNFSAE
jgi:hypothetical protein